MFRPPSILVSRMYRINSWMLWYSAVSMHNWATTTNTCTGTRSCPNVARDCEDCAQVRPRRSNRTGEHTRALMSGEGNVRMPGGYFFTFADEWHPKLTLLSSPIRRESSFVSCCKLTQIVAKVDIVEESSIRGGLLWDMGKTVSRETGTSCITLQSLCSFFTVVQMCR